MAKTKTPLLSLGSSGSISQAITTQRRGRDTLIRAKPFPAYRYTLPQAYQRWLYEDYAYLWTQQTIQSQRDYASLGSRYHLTGFQYWMKYTLTELPDIRGFWKLDNIISGATPDSSRLLHHATVFGASLTTGLIDQALDFDGIDDYLATALSSSYNFTGDFTFELITKLDALNRNLLKSVSNEDWNLASPGDYVFNVGTDGNIALYIKNILTLGGTSPISTGQWYHLTARRLTNKVTLYKDGILISVEGIAAGTIGNTQALQLARPQINLDFRLEGILDQVTLYDRALDTTEIARHSSRRYPP